MKKQTYILLSSSMLCALNFACSGDSGEPSSEGDGSGGSTTSTGGAIGTGGDAAAGGSSSGGGVATGGIVGAGGDVATGGDAGSGGDSGLNTGGSSGGGDGSGGEGTGGEAALTPADIADGLDGYLFKNECDSSGTASFECPSLGCQGALDENVEFVVAGETDATYDVTLHIYGVAELRTDYTGGTRRQGGTSNAQSNGDFFYEGGSYTPGAGYNVYGIRVEPAVAGAPDTNGGNNYFLNARDSSPEGHEVYALDFEATIPVQGGGTVTYMAYDPNCIEIMNNSETVRPMGSGTGPNGSLVVPLDAVSPAPAGFDQPLSNGGRTGQWVLIDVVDVVMR